MAERVTRRRYVRAVGVAAVGVTLSGCSIGGDGGDGRTVDATDRLTFEPATVSASVGDAVTWRNVGSVAHSVTAYGDRIPAGASYFASGDFDSEDAARRAYPDGRIRGGESYEHTFEVAGTYEYFCIPHERSGMTGTVVVRDG